MDGKTLWEEFLKKSGIHDCGYDAWSFGADPDLLAGLVCEGVKTATASLRLLYELDQEEIPREGIYSVVLDSRGQGVCVIKTSHVSVTPFDSVTEAHAYKEGEGDRFLAYWRAVHQDYFTNCLKEYKMEFHRAMEVVCEEFEVVYKP